MSAATPGRASRMPAPPAVGSRESRAAAAFLAPALGLILLLFVLPAAASVLLSVTDFDLYAIADLANVRFVGLANYRGLLSDPVFWIAVRNTFYFVLAGGPLTILVALGAALLVNARGLRFPGIFRTAFFAPYITTLVAVAVVWRYLYNARFGWLNHFLGFFGVSPIDWLGDPRWAMPAIILLAIWKNFGYSMVLFLAGLQNIPEHLYEAARIDGAGTWPQFRHITLPMLAPTFFFISVITAIGYFQVFAEPYVMTSAGTMGGPVNATMTIALLMYKAGFRFWNLGMAAAIAFVLFLIVLAATLLQSRLQKQKA